VVRAEGIEDFAFSGDGGVTACRTKASPQLSPKGIYIIDHAYRRTDLIYLLDTRREPSTSCGAAVRVKPKARLCEPWVNHLRKSSPEGATAINGNKRNSVHELSVAASRLA
jgi:hypothetical protein